LDKQLKKDKLYGSVTF